MVAMNRCTSRWVTLTDLFPENFGIPLDKSNKLVYNTSMLNEKKTLKENEMKNFIFCIKEIAIMFALISMVMLAAFGGTAILLSNL